MTGTTPPEYVEGWEPAAEVMMSRLEADDRRRDLVKAIYKTIDRIKADPESRFARQRGVRVPPGRNWAEPAWAVLVSYHHTDPHDWYIVWFIDGDEFVIGEVAP